MQSQRAGQISDVMSQRANYDNCLFTLKAATSCILALVSQLFALHRQDFQVTSVSDTSER